MKEFTSYTDSDETIPFTLDGDLFELWPASRLPGGTLLELAGAIGDPAKAANAVVNLVRCALTPESAVLFEERMLSNERPISLATLGEIVKWMMEEVYATDRPTAAPSLSRSGRRSIGANSTAGARPGGYKAPSVSPSDDSST